MSKLFFSKAVTISAAILTSIYCENSSAQSVRLEALKTQVAAAPRGSLDQGEEIVVSADIQKKMDVEFNSRRLLRFHQLWNLYLFRNEEAARNLQSKADAMYAEDTQLPMAAELALAEAERREPKEIKVTLRPETTSTRSGLEAKKKFNDKARQESNATRLTKVHAGLPPDQVSQFIEENAKALTVRLRAEIAAGGENAEKAKANLAYLEGTFLPKLRDPQYFSVPKNAFAKEFGKVLGTSGAATGR